MTSPSAKNCQAFRPSVYLDTRARTGGIPKIPHKMVVGEIKPHNPDGIRGGVDQLRKSGMPGTRLLLTYRPVKGKGPTTYEVLMPHPRELMQVITVPSTKGNRQKPLLTRLHTWYKIGGDIEESCAVRTIPYHACPALLGAQLEEGVRENYRSFLRGQLGFPVPVPSKSPWSSGPDILHEELAEFLAELAAHLQAA